MSIETYQFNLPITPGAIPPVLHLSQYDSGRTFTAILRDDQGVPFELDASSTAVIKGRNAAGIAWQQDCTVSGANVTFTPSGAATDQFGVMPVTIEITESEEIISPLCVVFHIQKAGYTNEEAVLSPDFETAIQAAVAQAIAEGGLGFSDEFKEALLACFNAVAWATTGGQALVDDLEAALYPDVHLVSITAAYDQDRPIYDTDSLDLVKLDLVVTANYSDGTSEVVTDYTLSGTLTPGTSTITVRYGGKTASISVVVYYISPAYQQCEWIGADGTQYLDTGIIPTGYSKCILDFESSKTNADAYQNIFGTAGDTPQGGGGIQHRFDMFIGSANTSATFAASELAPNFGAGVYTAAVSLPSATYVNQRLTYTADENTWGASVGTYSANLSGTKISMTRQYPLFIFARNGEGTAANLAKGKLYGATFEDASGQAFNLVPCYNKTSGEIGVFDKVSKEFIGNSGTGVFTKGNDVS